MRKVFQCVFCTKYLKKGMKCQCLLTGIQLYFVNLYSFLYFQAETCSLLIPELEFEMGGYALGGRFTTLEGLLDNVIEQINNNPMLGALGGDSATSEQKMKIDQFKVDLMALKECKKPFTIILDDPAGNSYIQVKFVFETCP